MKWLLRKCGNCKTYTLKPKCPKCGGPTVIPHPTKYSPHDKYARLRQPDKNQAVERGQN